MQKDENQDLCFICEAFLGFCLAVIELELKYGYIKAVLLFFIAGNNQYIKNGRTAKKATYGYAN